MKLLTTVLMFLTITATTSAAYAKSDKLTRHVPGESQILVGLELPELQKSFLYEEVMTVLKQQAGGSTVLGFVVDSGAFDLSKDVKSMLVAFEKAPTNPQNPGTPSGAVVLQGNLDPAKVKAAVTKKFGKLNTTKSGKLEVHSTSGLSLAFVDKGTLLIVDQGPFADKTWKAVADEKLAGSKNKNIKGLMSLGKTNLGAWLMVVTKGLAPAPGSPPMDGAMMSVDVKSGVALDFRTKFEKPDDAKKALSQFMEMKKTTGSDPLVNMLGAKPLLDNLSAKVLDERVLAMNTSMSETQVKQLMVRVKALSESPPPIAPSQGNPPQQQTAPTEPLPTGKGSNADFN